MSDYTFVNKVGANFTLFNCMFPVLLVCSGGFERADTSKMRRFALFVTLFTSITTIYGTYLFSGASPCRELATGQNSSVLAIYKMANIGGYGYIYYLVIITPCLVRLLLKRFSWNVLIVLLCNFYCIIRSEYTTALLLTFLGLCLSIMMFSKSKLLKVAMVMVGVLALTSFGQQLLYWGISQFSDSYSVSSRLEMVAEFSETGSTYGDMEDRGMLYNMSWNTFLDNPIFGGRFSDMCKLGNHSEFLDFLGYSGLVGMICLFMYLVYIARHTKIRSIKWSEPYNRITLIIAIVLASINTFMAPEMYYALVVIPLLTTDTTN